MHMFASHYFLQDYCKEFHPTLNPAKCAMVYSQYKPHNFYDRPTKRDDFTKVKKKFTMKDHDYLAEGDL